ncbi:glutaminyl-peptide cyclotransferase [Chryseobacterium sp. GMJ5]|uniref:Glutaminyl-peptide cyclotransferase n=1 Tax=Chryseobacterium gilvum TaxID=2976534 RepID=A0ABT2VYK3_9FLAO|nr:glutaminyl-peptide cyclotransferase [Chryseobacterium gilvum]MCU7614012.1 glutaminyl-peptide cyclotransferase [Chryseobacterium gilvum]
MKNKILVGFTALVLLMSCKNDEKILNSLADYNNSMVAEGYHFGDKIDLPKEVTDNAESIVISFGDKETSSLVVDPKYFTLGDNAVTFTIKTKSGEALTQDATINVFAKNPEANLSYNLVAEYPHDPNSFTEGFYMEGNMVYESIGQEGASKFMKYELGKEAVTKEAKQPDTVFSEGISSLGNKIYQLTYKNKKGFIYDKNSFEMIGEFPYPNVIGEGWGMTTDGKNLIVSDGTKNLYFLNAQDPSKVVKYISVAGNKEVYDQLNELEFHQGFIYSNVWHKPVILKINPANGEVVGKFDFTKIAEPFTNANSENVLNGIAFKGDNMIITGKNWPKIYEVSIK